MTTPAETLLNLDLFANVPEQMALAIIADTPRQQGRPGQKIDMRPVDYFVLIAGEARLLAKDSGKTMARLSSQLAQQPAWLYALAPRQEIQLADNAQYLVFDGARIDAAIDEAQQPKVFAQAAKSALAKDEGNNLAAAVDPAPSDMKKMTDWLRRSKAFAKMDLFDIVECAMAMQPLDAGADWDIIREGSEGNFFYVIESGAAEVWRSDPLNDTPAQKVAELGPGDSFGEEALLQEAFRNATVRMTKAGRLWRLEKSQFDELVRDSLLQEIDANEANQDLTCGRALLIDCRYDLEYDMARIPGAKLIPLDQIREGAARLDRSQDYLVYCRSGRRSRAAAFLMQRMGLKAKSIRGGLTGWPFDVEGNH